MQLFSQHEYTSLRGPGVRLKAAKAGKWDLMKKMGPLFQRYWHLEIPVEFILAWNGRGWEGGGMWEWCRLMWAMWDYHRSFSVGCVDTEYPWNNLFLEISLIAGYLSEVILGIIFGIYRPSMPFTWNQWWPPQKIVNCPKTFCGGLLQVQFWFWLLPHLFFRKGWRPVSLSFDSKLSNRRFFKCRWTRKIYMGWFC